MAYKRKEFKYSDEIKEREAALAALGAAPTYKEGKYGILADQALEDYMNRPKFSYDVNADALYNQYADKYTKQGKLAMQDTMGQSAALTGGYGNSWAQTAGQQTYQGYMQELTDKIPELQQLAYAQYQDRGNELLEKYGIYADLEAQDYSRHRDDVADYYTRYGILNEQLENAKADEWGKFTYGETMDYQLEQDEYNRKQDSYNNSLAWQKTNNTSDEEEELDEKYVAPLKYSDFQKVYDNAMNYVKYDEDQKVIDPSRAITYLGSFVNNGTMSTEDATAIAKMLGFDYEFNYYGWGYKDFLSMFDAEYQKGETDKDSIYTEIEDLVSGGYITKDEAKRMKDYFKVQR